MNKFVNPFEIIDHHTEWSAAAIIAEWINQIIREENLPFGQARIEKKGVDGKRPDCILYDSPENTRTLLLIEFKPPFYDVFDGENLKEPARKKATLRKSPYFATSNFKTLILWDTAKVNNLKKEEDQIIAKYNLSNIENLDYLENFSYQLPIQKELKKILLDLYALYFKKEKPKKLPLDEILIFRLLEKIKILTRLYLPVIEEKYQSDTDFRKKLRKWFSEQFWSLPPFPETYDFEKAARQTAYLLVNKIFFYEILRAQTARIPELKIPRDLATGGQLQTELQAKFQHVLNIDYETIYSTDFIDTLAFSTNNQAVIQTIIDLIEALNKYDWGQLVKDTPDTIGKIFENLIPAAERHNLGQYFTRTDVVDLILNFCLKNPTKDTVLDPACGTGTFLIQSYFLKRLLDPTLTHKEILSSLWGVDIAKFPAHLATINLVIRDLREKDNYPQIFQNDFFELKLGGLAEYPNIDAKEVKRYDGTIQKIPYPRIVNAVVGNPPYTRQEEIEDISGKGERYKEKLIESAIYDTRGKKLATISKRAGIHAYFFVHGFKFLQNGGMFGFIVSNSWLDVDYGKGLQEFFLKNAKIIAIIESKVERWFEDADINTCIVILEKCEGEKNKEERDNNLVRFVQLKKPLSDFIPIFSTNQALQKERWQKISQLKDLILAHDKYFEDEKIRIYPKLQKELWDEGFDEETQTYVGSKWGKYIRAPQIFFKILEKCKDKLVPLKEVADVRRGITTGANEFFYLTEEEIKRRGIEKEFWMHQDEKGNWVPNYIIKSPRECKSIVINPKDLKYRVLMIHKDKEELKGTNVLKYIKEGERKGFHKRPTCASRKRWYDLGKRRITNLNINYLIHDIGRGYVGSVNVSDDFQEIHTNYLIAPLINSSLFWFFENIEGRTTFGGGLLKIQTYEFKKILLPNPKVIEESKITEVQILLSKLSSTLMENIFALLRASTLDEVFLHKINPQLRKLDQIIMGDILGLTEEEQLEVYRAIIDLVSSRLKRAKSVTSKNKSKKKVVEEKQVEQILKWIGKTPLTAIWQKYNPLKNKKGKLVKLPSDSKQKPQVIQSLLGWQLVCGKQKIDCQSQDEAELLQLFVLMKREEVIIPENRFKNDLTIIKKEYERINKFIDEALEGIVNFKIAERIKNMVWENIFG
ncbi:MAG: HsdM family class I SAM-dependent methyltransferase [Microgenomates group bacterium]